jgi:hypothetical protein
MDADSYRAASFLDDRLMQSPVDAQLVPWPVVEQAAKELSRTNARWIFHIGHVGSTLLSRLLGEIDQVLAVREPRILRDVALSPPHVRGRYIGPITGLMSRTFASDDVACVKATSFSSEIAPALLPAGERALFMFATPANYIASILAGENSVQELRALEQFRGQRAAARIAGLAPARDDAARAALAWACEMTSLEAAADAMPDRKIAWCDFDRLLQSSQAALSGIASFFGFSASAEAVDAILAGPLMRRYSKAMEYDYSPSLRADLIAEATAHHRAAIDRALDMLRHTAERSPLLARALGRTGDF